MPKINNACDSCINASLTNAAKVTNPPAAINENQPQENSNQEEPENPQINALRDLLKPLSEKDRRNNISFPKSW